MKITFEPKPIATAPKDREIMLYLSGTWHPGEWDGLGWRLQGFDWDGEEVIVDYATHWCEMAEMALQEAQP